MEENHSENIHGLRQGLGFSANLPDFWQTEGGVHAGRGVARVRTGSMWPAREALPGSSGAALAGSRCLPCPAGTGVK